MKAYILIQVRTGEITSVLKHLHRVDAVKSAEMTFGECDIIAVTEADSLDALGQIIAVQIQTIPGVQSTNTCLAVDIDK